jgi:hypothetical protein
MRRRMRHRMSRSHHPLHLLRHRQWFRDHRELWNSDYRQLLRLPLVRLQRHSR